MAVRVLERAIYIEGSFDAVWTAVTQAEWHEDWYFVPCTAFGHRKNASCEWGDAGSPTITGSIETFRRRDGRVSHTFSFLGEPEGRVEWRVEPVGRIVRVGLRHALAARSTQTRGLVEAGWTVALSRLKTLVETGKPMALPAGEE